MKNKKPKNHWTKENILKSAREFKYNSLWRKECSGAYEAARKLNFLNECREHMEKLRSGYVSGGIIYVFEFDDNSCYIGLTVDIAQRFSRHMMDGPVFNKLSRNISFKFKILEHKTIYPHETQEKERFWAEFYKLNKWSLLNDESNLGALGGSIRKWTESEIRKSSLKFKKQSDWARLEEGAYKASIKMGIFEDVSSHMIKGPQKGALNPLFGKKNSLICGEKHGNSKLTKDDVRVVREKYNLGESQASLAAIYNVNQSTISNIINHKLWRDSN
jgi:hypothetical protein